MNKLENFVENKWVSGDGEGALLYDAVTGEEDHPFMYTSSSQIFR